MENVISTPTIQTKDGNTTSVIVHPCHAAWLSGPYTWLPSPGVFTSTMRAMIAPRNASSETSRSAAGCRFDAGEKADRVCELAWGGPAVNGTTFRDGAAGQPCPVSGRACRVAIR